MTHRGRPQVLLFLALVSPNAAVSASCTGDTATVDSCQNDTQAFLSAVENGHEDGSDSIEDIRQAGLKRYETLGELLAHEKKARSDVRNVLVQLLDVAYMGQATDHAYLTARYDLAESDRERLGYGILLAEHHPDLWTAHVSAANAYWELRPAAYSDEARRHFLKAT